MRRFIFIFLALVMCLGCKQPATLPEVKQELAVDITELHLDYRSQEVEIAVRSNQTIEVDVAVMWILYSVSEGGDGVSLFIMENRGSEPRSAEMVIRAGDLSHRVTIYQGIKPETMQLSLSHRSTHLDSPEWSGSDLKGVVEWGDGTTEEYHEGISHDYANGELHCVQFTMEGATSFRIERVGEIESVILAL